MSPEFVTLALPAKDSALRPIALPPDIAMMSPPLSIDASPSADAMMPKAP